MGYCQGLSFIVAVLLLHLNEEESFALFSVIMKEYQFRDMFKKGESLAFYSRRILQMIIINNFLLCHKKYTLDNKKVKISFSPKTS